MGGVIVIKQGSFDIVTAREITGDELARIIEAKARLDADSGQYDPPSVSGTTYWDRVVKTMHGVVYTAQYQKRIARIARKSA